MPHADHCYSLPLPSFDKPVKVLIVVSPYYKAISDQLLTGALAELAKVGAEAEVIEVPSVLELAPAIALAERMARFDGYVALGCVLRGETAQYETLCREPAAAFTFLGLQGAAVGNGVLMVEDFTLAGPRADPKGANKGGQAAAAALHLIALSRKWATDTKGIGFRP